MADAREISDRYTDLINAHDARAIGDLYADDGVLHDPTGEFRGRDAIVEYWNGLFVAFPDLAGRDEFKAESGETAINEWSMSGTNSGPMDTPDGTIPATGKRISMRGADALTVRHGRVQSHRVYYDQLTLMTQLGLVPEGALAG